MPQDGGVLRLLLVSQDSELVSTVTDVAGEHKIRTLAVEQAATACTDLNGSKFEGVMLDCDSVLGAAPVLSSVLESPSNRKAVIIAIVTGAVPTDFRKHSHFVMQRPLRPVFLRKTFTVVCSLMQRELRRYFRYAVELPITITRKGGERLNCTTLNLSKRGLAVCGPRPLGLGEEVSLEFVLPGRAAVSGSGEVVWDDRHGKSGLRLCCRTPQMRLELETWLDLCASGTEGLIP